MLFQASFFLPCRLSAAFYYNFPKKILSQPELSFYQQKQPRQLFHHLKNCTASEKSLAAKHFLKQFPNNILPKSPAVLDFLKYLEVISTGRQTPRPACLFRPAVSIFQ